MTLVSYIDILDYIGNDRECLIKGEELFNENKVKNVHTALTNVAGAYEVTANCDCNDTSKSNDVCVEISHVGKRSLSSKCTCDYGSCGKCRHVAATLIYLHRHPPDLQHESLLTKSTSASESQLIREFNGDAASTEPHSKTDCERQNQRQSRRKRRSTVLYQSEKDEFNPVIAQSNIIETDCNEELVDDPSWDKENDKDEDWGHSSDDNWEPVSERKRVKRELSLLTSKDSKDISNNRKGKYQMSKTEADNKAKELTASIQQGDDGQYSCHLCDTKFSKTDNLRDHLRDSHLLNKQVFSCSRCQQTFKVLKTLKAHEVSCDSLSRDDRTEKDDPSMSQKICETPEPVEEEEEDEESFDDLIMEPLQCLLCKVASSTRREMHDHYLAAHDKDTMVVCDRCGEFRVPGDHSCPSQLTFRCHMCRGPYKAGRDYWNHLIRASKVHGLAVAARARRQDSSAWRCGWPRCAERFASEAELLAHARLHLPVHVPLMCGVCMLVLRNTDAKVAHMAKHDAGVYECGACRHACTDKQALRLHWDTHATERPHRCELCGWRFTTATKLKVHARKFHEGGPFSCAKCPQKFDDRTDVRIHFGAAHGKLRCGAEGCAFRCANKASLERHARLHDRQPDEDDGDDADEPPPPRPRHVEAPAATLACTAAGCGQAFALLRELRAHARDAHGVCSDVKCPDCSKTFKSQRGLDEHRRVHTGEKPFICAECGMTFKRTQNLEYHMKGAHKNERNFVCPEAECGKRFVSNADMQRHVRYSHQDGKKWHLCPECGHKLPSLYNLKLHVQSRHTGERPHKCHLCDMGFVATSDLKKHIMFKHNKEHPFACPGCDKRYQRRRDLELHQRRHHAGDRHSCAACGKDFDTYASMMQHARYHTTEEPFQCAKCGRRFPHRMNLSRHLCTPDIKKNYHCQTCGLSFTTSGSLKTHRRRLHAAEEDKKASAEAAAAAPGKQAAEEGRRHQKPPPPPQPQGSPPQPGEQQPPPEPQTQPQPEHQAQPLPEPQHQEAAPYLHEPTAHSVVVRHHHHQEHEHEHTYQPAQPASPPRLHDLDQHHPQQPPDQPREVVVLQHRHAHHEDHQQQMEAHHQHQLHHEHVPLHHHDHQHEQHHHHAQPAPAPQEGYEDYRDKLWRGVAVPGDSWGLAAPVATSALPGEDGAMLGMDTYHELEPVAQHAQPLVLTPHHGHPQQVAAELTPVPAPPPPAKTAPPPLVSLHVKTDAQQQQQQHGHMVYSPAAPAVPVKVVTVSQPPPLAPVSQGTPSGSGSSLILGAPIQTTADGSFHIVFVPHATTASVQVGK